MPMHNPPHPRLTVRHDCLEPLGLSVTEGAKVLGVTRQALNNLVNDQFAVEWIDEREDYGEERSVLLGMTGGQLLYVAYTERGANIRIISARRVTRHEQDIYYRQNAE